MNVFDARNRAKSIAWRYREGQEIRGSFGEGMGDKEFLLELLSHHPQATEKIGCGVSHFFVKPGPAGGWAFCFKRTDGTEDHFSYLKCLRKPTQRELVTRAFRRAIMKQMDRRRQLAGHTGWHVHHVPPLTFVRLVARFLSEHRLKLTDIRVGEDMLGPHLLSPVVDQDWRCFHAATSVLEVLPPEAHKEIHRDDYLP